MNLQPGDRLSMRDALYSALLGSDNLAALTIADHVGREILTRRGKNGDLSAEFVARNEPPRQGARHDADPLRQPSWPRTPRREGVSPPPPTSPGMSIYAMRRNAFNFIVRQPDRQVSVTGAAGKRRYRIRNTNELIGEPGILGVKTGTTDAAGPCVSVCMERDPLVRQKADGSKGATPRRLIVVVLNNPDRFNRARELDPPRLGGLRSVARRRSPRPGPPAAKSSACRIRSKPLPRRHHQPPRPALFLSQPTIIMKESVS